MLDKKRDKKQERIENFERQREKMKKAGYKESSWITQPTAVLFRLKNKVLYKPDKSRTDFYIKNDQFTKNKIYYSILGTN